MSESLSIVIPVYRSSTILPELYVQLSACLENSGRPFEIIFVEDCGGDDAWQKIQRISDRDPRVRGIKLMRNFGQHNATLCGVRAARNEIIVTMDDDLQHPPDQISVLLEKLSEGYDIVYGVPDSDRHDSLRGMASWMAKLALQTAIGRANARKVSSFRAFHKPLCRAFDTYTGSSVSIDVLLSWGAKSFGAATIRHAPRRAGKSTYTWGKLVNHGFNVLTGFSTFPLRLASLGGFVFTVFGFGLLIWIFAIYLVEGSPVRGFTFLAAVITIFSGVQMVTLGIFGEYIARIFARTMDKPTYVIESQTVDTVAELSQANDGGGVPLKPVKVA